MVGIGVAVHATVLQLFVVSKGVHVEILHTTLLNLNLIPDFVIRLYQAIGQVRVYLVLHHSPGERFVGCPLSVDKCSHLDAQFLACVLLHERLPFIQIEDDLIALGMDGDVSNLDLNGFAVCAQQEVQWCDILRDGHVAVVRIDRRQLTALLHVLWSRRASE